MGNRSYLLFAAGVCGVWASPAVAAGESPQVAVAAAAIATDSGGMSADGAYTAEPASVQVQRSGWQFSAAPYLWMSGLKGDMGVTEAVEPVAVDLSFIDILGALKFALMGNFEARNGRFVATADALYLSMGADKDIDIREADFLDAELDTKTFIATATAGYRAVDQGRMYVDVFAGGRVYSMKTSLDLEGPQRSFSGSKTETWVDPVVGARLQAPLGQNWSLQTYADIGGFGIGSHFTWQVLALVQYDLSTRWSLSAGWRHLDIDFENDGFVFDTSMDGPILGAVYRF